MKRLWCIGIVFLIVLLYIYSVLKEQKDVLKRFSFVTASNPVTVWIWDDTTSSLLIIQIPSAHTVQGAYGYGKYSLESLWKLGFIDKKSGEVLRGSLEHVLAIPIAFFIGETSESLTQYTDIAQIRAKIFSPSGLGQFLTGRIKTSIPLMTYVSFIWKIGRIRPDAIRIKDLSASIITKSEELPDGTMLSVVSPDMVDVVLNGIAASETLDEEDITVSLFNTTQTAALGTQAARMLSNLGVLVVTVGNKSPQIDACEIKGAKAALESKTSLVISKLFECDRIENVIEERSDLEVYLGTIYAKRF